MGPRTSLKIAISDTKGKTHECMIRLLLLLANIQDDLKKISQPWQVGTQARRITLKHCQICHIAIVIATYTS